MKKMLLVVLLTAALAVIVYLLFFHEKTGWQEEESQPKIEVITGLETCQICGYMAMQKNNPTCMNCGKELTEQIAAGQGISVHDLLMLEQLDYFSRDTINLIVDLFGPKVTYKGYPKDPSWKPHPNVNTGQVNEFLRIRVDEVTTLKKELADTAKKSITH